MARVRFSKNSIRQIDGFWDTVFIKVMGKDVTLDHIEHEVLREEFGDPRIHFVLVCASIGCPLLESRAFWGEGLDERLDKAAADFVRNPDKVRLDKEKNRLYLSSIFEWYQGDFEAPPETSKKLTEYGRKEHGAVAEVLRYLPSDQREYILEHHPKIRYVDYDWSLNEQHKPQE